jgi:aspartyl-tRNA(Asn)/glutamyl-tRNA(Gln) amidotransferase subunit A
MARRAEDSGLLLEAIAGHDSDDSDSMEAPGRITRPDMHPDNLRGVRIGFVRHFHERDMPADPEVAASLEAAASVLKSVGATIVPVELPPLGQFSAVNRTILQAEAWSVHAAWLRTRPQDYAQLTRQRLLPGAFLRADDYVQAQRRRRRMIGAVEAVFREVNLLLTASAMDPPARLDNAGELARTYPRQARTPFNVTGHPALAMMAGLSRAGLPLSLQLVGRYWDEAAVIRAASLFERETALYERHPPGC